MKVTNFGPDGIPVTLGAWSEGVTSINSNANTTDGGYSALHFVQGITANGSNFLMRPIVNFAEGSNITLTVDRGPLASFPSNTIRIHATAGGSVSAGSNSTRVREVSTAGASTTLWSPYDHAHDGIGTITASSSNTMQRGTFNLRPGSGIALSLTDTDGDGEFDTTTIVATGGGGGGAGVSDYVSGASGTGQIIIPGMAGSADIRVAGTNDDEFDTTDTSDPMTGWTTLGTPTTHNINSTVKSHYYASKSATTLSLHGIYKATPAAPFTVRCKLSEFIMAQGNARAMLMIGEATPGKMVTLGRGEFTASGDLMCDNWTNSTTYGSTRTNQTRIYDTYNYFGFVVVSSTDITTQISEDGKLWKTYGTANFNPSFTVGAVGLIIGAPSTGQTTEAIFDWIRFT